MTYDFDRIINRYHMRSAKWGSNPELLSMSTADMDFVSPAEVTHALLQDVETGVYGYKTGHVETFLQAAVAWEKRRHNIELEPEWLSFAPGVIAALAQAIYALTKPGDKIVIQPPVYGPFFSLVNTAGRVEVDSRLIHTDDNRWEIDFDDLDKKCEGARAMLICSPHNPIGRVWTDDELIRVVAICKKHGLLLLVDEIHHDLMLDGREYHTPAQLCPDYADQIITAAAPSKTFNLAGMQTSYLCIRNPEYRKAVAEVRSALHIAGGVYGYMAGEAAYTYGDSWLDQLLRYLESNRDAAYTYLRERLPECPLADLQGTYLMWMDCRALSKSEKEVCKVLEEHKILLVPGAAGFHSEEGYLRINIGTPRKQMLEGLDRLCSALETLR